MCQCNELQHEGLHIVDTCVVQVNRTICTWSCMYVHWRVALAVLHQHPLTPCREGPHIHQTLIWHF